MSITKTPSIKSSAITSRSSPTLSAVEEMDVASAYRYRVFGLSIQSALVLPELAEEPSLIPADVTIKFGSTLRQNPVDKIMDDWLQVGAYCWARDRCLFLQVPEVADFLITADTIEVTPCAHSEEGTVKLFLLGNALGALLHLRGVLVLHGCSLNLHGHCFAICGNSGIGKSTLTAALIKKGCRLVADELCVIDADGKVLAGYPEIKLWQDALEVLAIDRTQLPLVRAHLRKYIWRDLPPDTDSLHTVSGSCVEKVFCLRWSWELQSLMDKQEDGRVKVCVGFEKFRQLRNQVYRLAYVNGLGLKVQNFQLLTALMARTDVLVIPRYKEKLSQQSLNRQADLVMDTVLNKTATSKPA